MDFLTSLNESTQFLIQIIVVLICLFYGAKKGGIALGLLGGIGILMLVFAFHIKPGKPAIDVMLTILAVVVASATLQASGGLDVMLQIAERILRRNPKFLTILAPFVTCFLTILCGTGHVVYTIMPIIYDIAIKNGIRPERPMAAASISSQMGIIASPVSVAVVSLTALLLNADNKLAGFDGYINLLQITIPSTLAGVLCVGIFSWFRGKDLDKDEEFQNKLKDPEFKQYVYGDSKTLLGVKLANSSWIAMWIFLGAIALVALLGVFDNLRPNWGQVVKNGVPQTDALGNPKLDTLSMVAVIQMFMLIAGSLIVIFTKTEAKKIASNEIFKSGMIALVAVFGISWMADTMFAVHTPMMKAALGDVVKEHPWTYAIMLLLISKFVNSQAAAIAAFVPLALGIGVEPGIIVAFAAACYGYYILPTYPSDLATIQFDRSGTTRIGKFVINHSFIIPGLIGVSSSCVFGYLLVLVAGYIK
ncbi:anaerobic C4-dicarboxylate transporter [Campylobacter upsaliensis]|uniref:Anaerobic C4-dicarboxylate membrane transporter DcuB n=3 Tax=Campylobacter upsaliensis TaxID=28080 RepID=A0A828R0Z6_CAMUP|nr:anaerobic C4-dicarboxylate transporter [Campylobacter upsaliensis]EAB5280957.1 anaerobic C4-dicarboxylate transporter [Campylobacter upsaliensis]EAH4720616.1 anaerobic C4-dicarboxylate transporter [Campylobacter upsaliensis]EAH5199641.1 anaerobic C4-dicarboxylate transporter [Campylobacter upsaliensis]EAH5217652.1 anaerobic C4-dicarboxylate transporter [Campylobacter upsaliensis]EAH5675800.1 anaerobic C4-dicarboxylate transporter [Campylobacter upsaliensis]